MDNGGAALTWALEEPALHGASVEVIHAFQNPYSASATTATLALDPLDFHHAAESVLADTMAQRVLEPPRASSTACGSSTCFSIRTVRWAISPRG